MMEPVESDAAARIAPAWTQRLEKASLLAFRWAVPVLLLTFLGYRLSQIGWIAIWHARPGNWGFYAVLPLIFFNQPYADLIIYRRLWNAGQALGMTIMLRKRYLDNVVLDYSGEVYFYLWAQRRFDFKNNLLLHAVKDSNILSGGAGLVLLWVILLVMVLMHAVKIPALVSDHWLSLGVAAFLPLFLCLILVIGGRKVTALTHGQMAFTFGAHLLRGTIGLVLEFALWWFSGALPTAGSCLIYVALKHLITRLPIVPNKDLLFAGAGIAMAGYMNFSGPAVAAVLVIATAFDQLFGFLLVGLPWLAEEFFRRRESVTPSS